MEQQQQHQHSCLEYLQSAERMLHESEFLATNNLELLAADRERLRNIAKNSETINQTLDKSEQKIVEMEHPWSLWTRKAKITRRNTETLTRHCKNEAGIAKTWGMKGFLYKRMRWTKKWKTRYCVIDGNVLHYYTNEKQMQSKPRGVIVLAGAEITEQKYNEFGRDNCFSITPKAAGRPVIFECPTPGDFSSWITFLRHAAGGADAGTAGKSTASIPCHSSSASPPSTTAAASVSTHVVGGTACIGVEEDQALDQIMNTLDHLDRISRVTREEIDDQNNFLRHITDNVETANVRVLDATSRVKAIQV